MKKNSIIIVLLLLFSFVGLAIAQDSLTSVSNKQLQQDQTIEYKKVKTIPDSLPKTILNNSETVKVMDNNLDITMAPCETKQFSKYLGPIRIADSYYDIIKEKPDFMTFRMDKVESSSSLLATFVDFTLNASSDATFRDYIIIGGNHEYN